MQVVKNRIVLPAWPSLRDKPAREPGIHVSDVIRYIVEKLGGKIASSWDLLTTWRLGLLFEEALAVAFQDEYAPNLGAILHSGVWFTPDGYKPSKRAIQEYKLTWKSMRNFEPTEHFPYMIQVKSYCHVVGVTKADIWVCFIMGDYKGKGPEIYCYEITFTPEEIAENWQMIMAHTALMQKEGRIK